MSFVTGMLLIDAPASALNNAGAEQGEREGNTVAVKYIQTRAGRYPYVSAQSFRYWLRTTLDTLDGWRSAPIFRENKVAYTDANPIEYWDDDIFGYMRAQSKKKDAREGRGAESNRQNETATTTTITRVSPFRMSTLVALAPEGITSDFGVMSRHTGDPVPYEHQFYRATLKGIFSLDLAACGTFSYREKTGFLNLDDTRRTLAEQKNLHHLVDQHAYRLPDEQRVQRVATLFDGLSQLEGGAKLALHYTDVMPPFVLLAVTRGGNNIFQRVAQADTRGLPTIHLAALREALDVFKDEIVSPLYLGWSQGYLDDQRAATQAMLQEVGVVAQVGHPRDVLKSFASDLRAHPMWLD